MAMSRWPGIVALVFAVGALSCDGSGAPGGGEADLYLPEEDRSLQSLTVDADRLTLVYDRDASEVGLVEGLLVAGAAQGGYLRQIERAALVGTTAVLETRNVALTDVVAVGTLHEALVPTGTWQLEPGGEAASMAAGGELDLGGLSLFEGYSGEADLQVSIVDGSFAFDPVIQLDLALENGELRQFAVVVSGPLALDLSAEASLDLKYSYATEVLLASYRQPVSASLGQVPLAGEIEVALRGGFELSALSGGSVCERVRISSHVRAGAAYDGTGWSSIWSVEPETAVEEAPQWDFDADASFRVWIVPEIRLTLYGVDGPVITLEPFLDASLTGVAPPQWTLASGLAGQVEVPTEFLDPDLEGFAEVMPAEGTLVAENDDTWVGWSQVSAGDGFTCGLSTEGELACWGEDLQGQASPPSGHYTTVTAGRAHACALADDGSLACWGRGDEGQCTPPPAAFVQVEAGHDFTCGVTGGGHAVCWGRDPNGQSSPPGLPFAQVSAGTWHGCGVTTYGDVACWGNDADGQASPPEGEFEELSARWRHTCGLQPGGTLVCWGCGQSDPEECDAPVGSYLEVSAGRNHSCALNGQGRVTCWGANVSGQSQVPLGWFSQVSAGHDHTCAVRTSGELSCWGADDLGQSTPPEAAP